MKIGIFQINNSGQRVYLQFGATLDRTISKLQGTFDALPLSTSPFV